MHENILNRVSALPTVSAALVSTASMTEYHKVYLKVEPNPIVMTIQEFFRTWHLFWKKKGKHQYLGCCYCLFGVGRLEYVYSVNLIQKQENMITMQMLLWWSCFKLLWCFISSFCI